MSNHSNPKLWDTLKGTIMKGDKGGKPNQWSARKAQLLVKMYVDAGGEFIGKKLKNNSLARWTKQNWKTKSGMPSLVTGERYLPEKAIEALSDKQYEETSRKKREDLKLGHQFSGQPDSVKSLIRSYINN
jgi:hypothetical protein